MFRIYAFTEMPYPYTPPDDALPAIRTTIPSKWFDPDAGHELYNKYLDLYGAADDLGLDIMLNEHHATATCLNSTVPLHLAILARETSSARLLALGNPVGNRPDPVRVAEELATIDVLSLGRLEAGFVRGTPTEIHATNTNPTEQRGRFWEAVDLITKAWTSHDGPFSWEGDYFHHRQVNVWPRPYQTPHPPVWVTTLSASSAPDLAARDYVMATIINGKDACRTIFDGYRKTAAELGRPGPIADRLAYCAYVFVGDTHEQGLEHAKKLQWFLRYQRHTPPQFLDPPGYLDAGLRARMRRARVDAAESAGSANGGSPSSASSYSALHGLATAPIEQLTEGGYFFAGSPDTVFEQIRDFYEYVGGFGHLIAMTQSSTMPHDLTVRSMRLLAEEVLPRVRDEVHEPALRAVA